MVLILSMMKKSYFFLINAYLVFTKMNHHQLEVNKDLANATNITNIANVYI